MGSPWAHIPVTAEARDDALVAQIEAAWLVAEQTYWERRAREFEAARPRRNDFHGQATRAQLRARYDALTETAAAYRARGGLAFIARAAAQDALADCGGLAGAAR